jgi:CubicO group peptidase (beta-lactamase class C family)
MNFEQTVDAYITAEMQRKQIPGLSLVVVKNGTAVVEKSYGLANVEPLCWQPYSSVLKTY